LDDDATRPTIGSRVVSHVYHPRHKTVTNVPRAARVQVLRAPRAVSDTVTEV
jgi:hypothetical protein